MENARIVTQQFDIFTSSRRTDWSGVERRAWAADKLREATEMTHTSK